MSIKKQKTISESTLKQYNMSFRLFCTDLNLNNPYDSFIKLHYKISQRTKNYISNESIKTALSAILYKLRENNINKELQDEYLLLLNHMRKICMYKTQNPKNNNKIPDWEYLLEMNDYWKTSTEIDADLYYVISSVYVLVPPRRITDYINMFICNKPINPLSLKNINDEKNYLYYNENKAYFIFNNYKTKKTYGSQIFRVPNNLMFIIINYIHQRNLKDNDNLFMLKDTKGSGKLQFYRLLQKTFNCSVDAIRHSYISYIFNNNIPTTQELKQTSLFMAHSISMHLDYRKDNYNYDENSDKIDISFNPELINYINPNSIYGQRLKNNDSNYILLKNIINSVLILYLIRIYLIK